MRKLFTADTPATLAACTCLVVFLACFFCLRSMPRYLARRSLAQQGHLLARGFIEAIESARQDLTQLPSYAGLNCQNGVSFLLAQHEFENEYVRWFGVAQNGRVVCRSPIVLVDMPGERKRYPLDDGWAAMMGRLSWGVEGMLLIQSRPDGDYLAMLQPLLFDFENPVGCKGCVTYEAVVGPNREVAMKTGSVSGPVVISSEEEASIFKAPVRLAFSATQTYVDNFKRTGLLVAAGIAAIVALVVSYLLYGLLTWRTSIANLVRKGIREDEFLPYYQPVVDGRDGSVLGAEALVRWFHKGTLIDPAQFIPFAEESGLIQPITEQMFRKVLADIRRLGWIGTDRYVSINVVPDQIVHSDFCAMLLRQLEESGIPGKNIAIEITERRRLSDLAEGRSRLLCLKQAGVDIKIDDCGTGFGGFSYVQELPVSTLKIDRMFVDALRAQDDAKRPVLDAIIHFANTSGLELVAEGVETLEQVDYLVKSGVYAIQGFVYARPMPADELMKWVGSTGARTSSEFARTL
jgi:sensor c-di-GMP phosphodiesterase-like protein